MKVFHKKWQLFLYGMGGMGVNLLNIVIGSYLCDALNVGGFGNKDIGLYTYATYTLVFAAVWGIFKTIAKIIDGFIDIPLATFSDNLRTKWGRRRPALIMGLIPMTAAYIALLNPISKVENSIGNTIWCGIALTLFYVFYTLTMGTYYATFSEVTTNEKERLTLSNYKTIFDIIYFLLAFGLVPLFITFKINIKIIGYIFLPFVLTMLIPIFMIKEGSTLKKDIGTEGAGETGVNIFKAIKYCLTNKAFVIWMVVYAALQFGLQLFIAGENVYYSGPMGFDGQAWKTIFIMAAVFSPVPGTIFLYNFIVRKKGIKFGIIYSMSTFTLAMIIMAICHKSLIKNQDLRLALAIIGGLISSLGIGCFFSISYTIPSHLAALQKEKTGDSNPTMYFAVQGLFSGISAAIATGVVWENIKPIVKIVDGEKVLEGGDWVWLLPILVMAMFMVAIGLTFLLPKSLGRLGKGDIAEKNDAELLVIEEGVDVPVAETAEETAEIPEETEVTEEANDNETTVNNDEI